jgi:tetratricopeptide (TPR) repeat protein
VDGVSEAVEHFQHAVRLNAELKRPDPRTHYRLGVASGYSDEWHTGQAVVAFEGAVREAAIVGQTSDDAALYHFALAQSLQVLGRDPNRVIREAEQCIKLCNARPKPPVVPGTPKPGVLEPFVVPGSEELALAHIVVGRAYLDLGRAADAATSLVTAVRHRPRSVHAWLWLGKAYFACGETRQGVEATNRAHKLEPTDAEVLSTLGEYALSEGDPKRAIEYFNRAKKQASKSSRLSASQPGRLFSTDDGILRAEQLAAAQSLGSNAAVCKNAKPTVELGRAAAARKHFSVAARIFQTLLAEPHFNDTSGEVARLAVGAAVCAGRDGLFGECDKQPGAGELHALARKWADEELNRVRTELEQVARGKGSLTREGLLVRVEDFQTDPLLAPVRESYLRAKLGAAERRSWESFWDAWNETALSVRALPTLAPPTIGSNGGGLGGF